jgi:excisionase family DNA binding protein
MDTSYSPVIHGDTLLTAKAAAMYLGVSRTTLYRLIGQKKIEHYEEEGATHGKHKLYRVKDLNAARVHVGPGFNSEGQPKQGAPSHGQRKQLLEQEQIALEKSKKILRDIKVKEIISSPEEQDEKREEVLTKLRDRLIHMASATDLPAIIFAMLESPIESTRTKGISLINDVVFKKTPEVEKPIAPWEAQLEELDKITLATVREQAWAQRLRTEQNPLPHIEAQ